MAWASSSNILLQRAHSHCALPLNLCAGTSRHVGGVTAMFIRRSPGTALSSGRGALVWRGALCRRALPARSAGALCRRALPARSAGCGALSRARRALSGAARSLACPHCNGLTRWLDAPLSRAQVAAPSRAGAALGLRAGAHTFAPLFIVRAWAGGRTSRIAALANNSAYCRHTCSSLRSCWWCATAVRQTQQLSLLH